MSKVNDKYRNYMYGREGGVYYHWLALAVRLLTPRHILELGNHLGASTLMMYSEIRSDTELFLSVDIVHNLAFVPDCVFADPRMRFAFGNDLDLSIYGDPLPLGFDFVYIDTLHERQQLEDEWAIYQHLCTPGALVVLDDIHLNDMYGFWESLPYPKLDISDLHTSGFGVFTYLPSTAFSQTEATTCAYRTALQVAHRRLGLANQELAGLRPPPAKPSWPVQAINHSRSMARRLKHFVKGIGSQT